MPFTLRAPAPADVEELAALHIGTWRETYAHVVPDSHYTPELLEQRRSLWTRVTSQAPTNSTWAVAERDGRIIGFAGAGRPLDVDPPAGRQLYVLYLERGAHGGGAGQALLDSVLGEGPAFLWVAEDNPRSRAFYRRNGFVPDGARQVDDALPDLVEVREVRS